MSDEIFELNEHGIPVFDPDIAPPAFNPDDYEPAHTGVTLSPGDMVRGLREDNQLTQEQLAQKTGIPQTTISGIESGRIALGIQRSIALAEALNVHPATIVFSDYKRPSAA